MILLPSLRAGQFAFIFFLHKLVHLLFSQGAVLEPIMPMIIKVSLMVNGKEEGGHMGSPFPLFYFY